MPPHKSLSPLPYRLSLRCSPHSLCTIRWLPSPCFQLSAQRHSVNAQNNQPPACKYLRWHHCDPGIWDTYWPLNRNYFHKVVYRHSNGNSGNSSHWLGVLRCLSDRNIWPYSQSALFRTPTVLFYPQGHWQYQQPPTNHSTHPTTDDSLARRYLSRPDQYHCFVNPRSTYHRPQKSKAPLQSPR